MEEINQIILEKIGLTGSEIKVYLALLKLGVSSKSRLLKESKIASSKIYEVIDKLIDKGLCGTIIKDGIKHFSAAPPSRIRDYISQKKQEIIQEEKAFEDILPKLESIKQLSKEAYVELFLGWKGMETVYNHYLSKAKKNDEVFIIGAGIGNNEEKLEIFYSKYGRMAFKKGLKINVLFNDNAREYVKKIEKNIGISYKKRFLFEHTPSELLMFKDITLITIRRVEPILILIKDKETYNSFKEYFKELWKIAKR